MPGLPLQDPKVEIPGLVDLLGLLVADRRYQQMMQRVGRTHEAGLRQLWMNLEFSLSRMERLLETRFDRAACVRIRPRDRRDRWTRRAERPPPPARGGRQRGDGRRSEEHTSELQSLMRISYAVFCLKKKQISR